MRDGDEMDKVIRPLYLTELENLIIRSVKYGKTTVREVWIEVLDQCFFAPGVISERRIRRTLNNLCEQGILEKLAGRPCRYVEAMSDDELAKGIVNGAWFGALATYHGEMALRVAVEYHTDNFH